MALERRERVTSPLAGEISPPPAWTAVPAEAAPPVASRAGFWPRLGAWLIDGAIVSGVSGVLTQLAGLAGDSGLRAVAGLLTLAGWAYYIGLWHAYGATPGARAGAARRERARPVSHVGPGERPLLRADPLGAPPLPRLLLGARRAAADLA